MHLKNKGKYKRNLVSYWAMENPILADGEIIVVETFDGNTRIKVGDGVSSYGELPYMDEDEGIETTISQYNIQRETKPVTTTYEPVKEVVTPKTPKLDPVPVVNVPVIKSLSVVNPTPTPVVETTEAFVNVNLKGTFINEQKLNPADVTVPSEHFTDIFATKEKLNPTLIKKLEPIVREEPTPEVSQEDSQEEQQKVIEEETQPKPRRTRRPRKARAPRAKVTTEV
jgi:hypothetical protein